jgi:hypothetical protein
MAPASTRGHPRAEHPRVVIEGGGGVSVQPGDHLTRRRIVEDLAYEHVRVAGNVVQIDRSTWAIHGLIAVDGDVILAEVASLDDARAAIEQLWASETGSDAGSIERPDR